MSIWDRIYDVLIEECEADESLRRSFVPYLEADHQNGAEFRFQGSLGFGGKLYSNHGGTYVSCYREDQTPERMLKINKANQRIKELLNG